MKVAVVGSGVAGLGAVWALNEYSEHEVHLFEADDRPGGHANTVEYTSLITGLRTNVDTGFVNRYEYVRSLLQIVQSCSNGDSDADPPSYPNLLRFLKLVGVPTTPTEMTFSVTRDRGAFEWAGDTIFTVFCQPKNLFRAGHWRMIWDVLRFNSCARKLVEENEKQATKGDIDMSIGDYLEREGYSDSFRDDYLIPMTAAIWSTPPDKCSLDFPARTLLRFMHNHHLLQLTGKPSWLTIPGGSHTYVRRVLDPAHMPTERQHYSSPVTSVKSIGDKGGVLLTRMVNGEAVEEKFDAVILATHSDTALRILGEGASVQEKEILGKFGWSQNEAVLHCDEKLMPVNKSAWSCWNYLTSSEVAADGSKKSNVDQVALTCMFTHSVSLGTELKITDERSATDCMNHLQHIPEKEYGPVLVTLNPPFEPRAETIAGRWRYEHPIVSAAAVEAQRLLPSIQNVRGISYAGAWTKYGFHEDGFTSGIRVAQNHLGVKLPFDIRSPDRQAVLSRTDNAVDHLMHLLEVVRRLVSFFLFFLLSGVLPVKS